MYLQNYDPLGNAALSTIVAALPILTLLYFIAIHPSKDSAGNRRLGISAPWAAFYGVLMGFAVNLLMMRMPVGAAISSFVSGALSGFIGIIWIVVGAMFLYTITLVSGKFEIVKESIIHVTFDRRLQVLVIAFSFGAIIEGTCGFGTPVAIAGAMLVGLGFPPLQSAVLNLIANTAPVAYGAIGTPIVTLAQVTGLNETALSTMAGRQLPFASILIPFWLVVTFVRMEGGTWREAFEVWPATLVAGVVFAVVQNLVSASESLHLLTDVIAGLASVIAVVLFLRVWHPKVRFHMRSERAHLAAAGAGPGAMASDGYEYPYTVGQTINAWVPWAILILCVAIWGNVFANLGYNFKAAANTSLPKIDTSVLGVHVSGNLSNPIFDMPYAHKLIQRTPPVVPANAAPESVQFAFNYLSAAGTGVVIAAILSGLYLRLSAKQWKQAIGRTAHRLRIPVLVIGQVLGLAGLTRLGGTDAILGLAFTATGFLYPFFAAFLGWLGVFLAGSDTASNALFGSLQKITAQQLHLNPILITASNSTGGVMGKMIDPQSITVATSACYEDPTEGKHALGPIFRTVVGHSIVLAAFMGLIVMLQAYVFTAMVPAG